MSVAFNGSQEVTFANYTDVRITGNLTLCAWIRFSTSQSNKGIAGRWGATGAYVILVYSAIADRIRVAIKVGGVVKGAFSASTYNDGNWHHVALIFDGANVLLKIDAGATESVTGDATTGPIDDPTDSVEVGSYGAGTASGFTGDISDAAIFNRALSSDELRMIMRFGAHRASGLQFDWRGYSTAYQNANLAPSANKTQGTTTGTPATASGPPTAALWGFDTSFAPPAAAGTNASYRSMLAFWLGGAAAPAAAGGGHPYYYAMTQGLHV